MVTQGEITIRVNPSLRADELFAFYERNDICEVGYGKETAGRILMHPHLIVAAFAGEELVAVARATSDGLSAHVMEFSLDLRYQGANSKYANGSLIEADGSGVGRRLGECLLNELEALGVSFVTSYIVAGCEEPFYQSLGFHENEGHLVYYVDRRPYVTRSV